MIPEPEKAQSDGESRRFDELLMRYWDDNLDAAGLAELNAALTSQPDLRAAFADMSLQILTLADRGAAAQAIQPAAVEPARSTSRRPLLWTAALVLALAGLTALLWRPTPPVATPDERADAAVVYVQNADGEVQPVQQWAISLTDGEPAEHPGLPTDTFLARFGRAAPAGWRGELVFHDLPAGAEAALRTVPQPHPHWGLGHAVQTPNAWTAGLFAIHTDSWFHARFRVEKPGFFHVLVVARDPDLGRRSCVVLEAPHFWLRREPGRWHTVHLPFADFRPTEPNRLTERPLVAFIVVVDSQKEDLGLTLERFWVTRGPETQ
ncbi:MAG: hypothetical protein JNM56_05370 [Planctomycetia bacterium]|nr:hypothetical protein [Planctomycetia bacterium]